ncbi:hypothetical protein DXX94_10155 [Thalassotalea euphylliae]|uniref:J domain-containing protein n=1 Tax=Thalassotalea euphylliae TaxID=1655234 RepID=A0A3E0U4D0_9GAMM|nr:hypothetical protein DXX94_10155 [Thalassotalea euphylliae]
MCFEQNFESLPKKRSAWLLFLIPIGEALTAYKKLMNQNHPDKVYARTGSESEKAKAEQKTKQFNVAWETIQNKLK